MRTLKAVLRFSQPLAFCCVLGIGTPTALAQSLSTLDQQEYAGCMQQTRIDPNVAFERALQWEDIGGGMPAKHCAASALMALGQYSQAAARLEEVARMMPSDASDALIADVLAHAGIAWFQAGDLEQAFAMQSAALELAPDAAPILVDRAMVLAERNQFEPAIEDLSRAIEINPEDPVAYTMRASAYRFLDQNERAMADAETAMRIDPKNPEALLERGIMRRLTGDIEGARQDWLQLIELHDGRPAAESARRNLERLDVKAE